IGTTVVIDTSGVIVVTTVQPELSISTTQSGTSILTVAIERHTDHTIVTTANTASIANTVVIAIITNQRSLSRCCPTQHASGQFFCFTISPSDDTVVIT
ncbi:MAG: hypothetical protein R8M11_09170, partial [Gallionella sp.]